MIDCSNTDTFKRHLKTHLFILLSLYATEGLWYPRTAQRYVNGIWSLTGAVLGWGQGGPGPQFSFRPPVLLQTF